MFDFKLNSIIETLRLKIGKFFDFSRTNSDNVKLSSRIDLRDIYTSQKIVNYNFVVSNSSQVSKTIQMLTSSLGDNLPDSLRGPVKDAVRPYENKLIEDLISSDNQDVFENLGQIDNLFSIAEGAKLAVLTRHEEVKILLGRLVASKIISDSQSFSLQNVLYASALSIAGKLTGEQLRILTIALLLRWVFPRGTQTWDEIMTILDDDNLWQIDMSTIAENISYLASVGTGYQSVHLWLYSATSDLRKRLFPEQGDTDLTGGFEFIKNRLSTDLKNGTKLICILEFFRLGQFFMHTVGTIIASSFVEQLLGISVDIIEESK